jgi:Rrf2 family iron-sulfur cluster assembly transcriptional regulator
MHLNNANKYAITFLKELSHGHATKVETVSKKHGIDYDFLQQLSLKLRRAGLISSRRGPGGGLLLARTVTLLDVVKATDYSAKIRPSCPLQKLVDEKMATIIIVQ